MPGLQRAAARRATARPRAASIVALLGVLALLPAAARASCQTIYCHHQQDLHARTREAEAREELARDPGNLAKWQRLMRELQSKPAREREIARYVAHVDWEARPELEIDLEARLRDELASWIADWKLAFPGRGEPWCAEAQLEASPAARVEMLRIAAARLADDVTVHNCLAEAFFTAGLARDAETVLEEFLARHPDEPSARAYLVRLLYERRAPTDEIRAAIEERVRRSADDRYALQELIRFYDANGLDDQRDRVLAEIETGDDFDARNDACSALSGRSESSRRARARCLSRVLADFPAAEVPESGRWRLDSARDGLLATAIHGRDWPAIRGMLASWPAESLGEAWARVGDSTNADGCRALRAAWSEGALRPALVGSHAASQAGRLAWSFQRCGEPALAEEVQRPLVAGASDDDLAVMDGEAALAEKKRRAQSAPSDPRRWYELDNSAGQRPLAERLPHLLAWHDAMTTDPEPALRLSRAYEAAGKGEEAVRWLVEAAGRHRWLGTDLLLQAAALALRFHLHDAAAANARKVLGAAASPRQHAEAHYVLGRVALREGRREEAASELLRYFPLRMRYVAGCGSSPDRGLLVLLLANYDLPRLRAYLQERDAALAWYREHLYNPPPTVPSGPPSRWPQPRYSEPLSCLQQSLPPPLQPELTLACVPAGVYDYLAKGGPDAAPAGERARRRREAAAGFACPPGPWTDLESQFYDKDLLSFSTALTAAG